MQTPIKLSFVTMVMMISFASVNAVLFTPALPNIAHFFDVSVKHAEQTIIWFLIAYTLGQLLYGPIANRFGRKPALYLGIAIQIISSFVCVLAGFLHEYTLLVAGRFFLALGSGVGLKIAFTLVNECYEPHIASQKTSYLMIAFAITPALGIALGGILNTHFGWMSCFYAGAVYGVILLIKVIRLPETQTVLHKEAFHPKHLIEGYTTQFKNTSLTAGGFLMGCGTSFVYIFAALAPFIAMDILGMSSMQYGLSNLIPAVGLIAGSLSAAPLAKKVPLPKLIYSGIIITTFGIAVMFAMTFAKLPALYSVFFPMFIVYFGLSFVIANASAYAMGHTQDKAHGSAVMNFINMGVATVSVISLGLFHVSTLLLPIIYLVLCVLMGVVYAGLNLHSPLKTR